MRRAMVFLAVLSVLVFSTATLTYADTPDQAGDGAETESSDAVGEGAWLNYEFVPGANALFFEDFSEDQVGNFPSRLTFVNGNMEVAEWEGRRWLRASSRSDVLIPLPEVLPERFTLEFEYYTGGNSMATMLRFADPSEGKPHVEFRAHLSGIKGGGINSTTRTTELKLGQTPFHCRVMVDGAHVKVYVNETRTANVPTADLGRDQVVRMHIQGTNSNPVMITNVRVAESQVQLYDALSASGRVVLKGILFETDSAVLLPESTPTLEEIGEMLTSHPEMRIVIEGHTDSVGEDAYNLTLSEQRAASVRDYLVERHGVDGERLTVEGYGEERPADTNDTPEGRHNNRRVEVAIVE